MNNAARCRRSESPLHSLENIVYDILSLRGLNELILIPRARIWVQLIAGIALFSILVLPTPAWSAEPVSPPNIVVMMTDDQRYDCLSCAGHPFIKTPNMDRIARGGYRFTNMFVTNSLCAPSRATL